MPAFVPSPILESPLLSPPMVTDRVAESESALIQKYSQLSLDFSEEDDPISPLAISLQEKHKLYAPLELVQYPFFLQVKSQRVVNSRKGYRNSKKIKALKKQGLSKEEIIEQTKIEISNVELEAHFENIGWTIKGSLDYGLPDGFDGRVWNVIQNLVSDIYVKTGRFYVIYLLTINQIQEELIEKGVFKYRDSKLHERISDSLYRLKYTAYVREKGTYRKDTNQHLETEKYTLGLVTDIYERGTTLPNGTKSTKLAVAIDPLIALNLRHNHFLILVKDYRERITAYESMTLFDKLSYFAVIELKKGVHALNRQCGIKPHKVIGYYKVCEYLGMEPVTGAHYKKSRVEAHLKPYHDELIREGKKGKDRVAEAIHIEQRGRGKDKTFNFIYVYDPLFLQRVWNMIANEEAGKILESVVDAEKREKHLARVTRQVQNLSLLERH